MLNHPFTDGLETFGFAIANPFDAMSECRLGEIAAKRGDSASARDRYAHALAIQPDSTDANLGMGRALVAMQQPAKAQPYLERAVHLDPSNFTAHFRLAAVYRIEGRVEDAQREIEQFQRYKDLKAKLADIFHEMRLTSANQERADKEAP